MRTTPLRPSARPERTIVWAGAGISFGPPSCLPPAEPLTHFALSAICGRRVTNRIFSIWTAANRLAGDTTNPTPFGRIPRLETILGIIGDVEANAQPGGFSLMEGFRAFAEAPFNSNHAVLALLLSRGGTVITTNFDLGVQKAYAALLPSVPPLNVRQVGSACVFEPAARRHSGRLIHLHGTADNIRGLGATIAAIKPGLARSVADLLEECFRRSTALHFVGYSGSDWFDINPYLTSLAPRTFSKLSVLFFQHGSASAPSQLARLTAPFGRVRVFHGDTSRYLAKIFPGAPGPFTSSPFAWEKAFRRSARLAAFREARPYVIGALANGLGINLDRLEAGASVAALSSSMGHFNNAEVHRTLAVACRMQQNAAGERHHYILAGARGPDMLGYYHAHRLISKARKTAMLPAEILAAARRRNVELDWRPYTSMSVHGNDVIVRYLARPRPGGPTPADRVRLDELLRLAQRLGNRPLRGVNQINQVVTAWRLEMVLHALRDGTVDPASEARILHLYGEGASLIGYVSAWRDAANAHLFRATCHADRSAIPMAHRYAARSRALARRIGDLRGEYLAETILALVRVCRAGHSP